MFTSCKICKNDYPVDNMDDFVCDDCLETLMEDCDENLHEAE
jgi:hypothetical protein